MTIYRGHLIHVAGSPSLDRASDALVSDRTARWPSTPPADPYSGSWAGPAGVPSTISRHDRRVLLPGFVDTHVHFPQTLTTDEFGGGSCSSGWSAACSPPSPGCPTRLRGPRRRRVRPPADLGRHHFRSRLRLRVSRGAGRALHAAPSTRGLRVVSGRGIQTVGPASAAALTDHRGRRDRPDPRRDRTLARSGCREAWPAHARTALAQVAVVPRFSLAVTPRDARTTGRPVRRGQKARACTSTRTSTRTTGRATARSPPCAAGTKWRPTSTPTTDGNLPGSQVGGESLLGRRSILAHAVHCTRR